MPSLAALIVALPSLATALSQARPDGDMSLLPADRARTQWAAASDVLPGGEYAWQLDATAPRLVLPPKVGTTAMIQFVNDCAGGRIAPTQLICNQDECSAGLGGRRGAVGHLHCVGGILPGTASSGSAAFPQPHEYVYGVARHPVERLVSFFNFRLDESSPRDDWRAAGLPFESSTTIEAVIDAATNATLTGGFYPFDSLHEYLDASGHTKILCSVDEFMSFVQNELGFHGCPAQLPQSNVSPRTRGGPRPDQVERLASVLSKDMALWGAHCGGADAAARRGQRMHKEDEWFEVHLAEVEEARRSKSNARTARR